MLRTYLFGAAFIMAWHVTLPLIAVYATSLGAGPVLVGATAGASVILPLFLAVFVGAVADRFGTAALARASAALFAAAYGLMVVTDGIVPFIGALALVGLADIGLVVAAQTIVAVQSTPRTRDRDFGRLTVWMSMGSLLRPVLGGTLADLGGYRAGFAGSLFLGLLTVAVAWALPETANRGDPQAGGRLGQPVRTAAALVLQRPILFILLTNAAVMFAFSLRTSFFPLHLNSVGFSATLIGILFSINSLCSIAVRPTIGAVVARFGYVAVLGLAVILIAAASLLTPGLTSFLPLAAAMGMIGAAMGYMQPLGMSLISGGAPSGAQGVALGLRISVMQLAQVIGPLACGLAVTAGGLPAAFYVAAGVASAGLIPVWAAGRELGRPFTAEERL